MGDLSTIQAAELMRLRLRSASRRNPIQFSTNTERPNRGDANKIQGCDLHARQQTIAMVDTETGEFSEKTLAHEGNMVREFSAGLDGPVVVGIEATGAMQWFLELLEELGIECRVGHPAKIRSVESGWAKSPPALPLAPYTGQRRNELLSMYSQLRKRIQELDQPPRRGVWINHHDQP